MNESLYVNPLIVLAAYEPAKAARLLTLYSNSKPPIPHELALVYNGFERFGEFPQAILYQLRAVTGRVDEEVIQMPNTAQRDIGMYYRAVMERPGHSFYWFMNDDIVHIRDGTYLNQALQHDASIVGAQYNLSTYVPVDKLEWGSARHKPKQFIRTSAFGATEQYFLGLCHYCGGNPQIFEKSTLSQAPKYAMLNHPASFFDSNLQPFQDYLVDSVL